MNQITCRPNCEVVDCADCAVIKKEHDTFLNLELAKARLNIETMDSPALYRQLMATITGNRAVKQAHDLYVAVLRERGILSKEEQSDTMREWDAFSC